MKTVELYKNIVLSVITVILVTLLIEGLLILKNSDMKNYDIEMWKYSKELKKISSNNTLGHEHKTNKSSVLQGVEISLNNFGMRGEKIDLDKIYDRRILFLGSSITLGWGVEENKVFSSIIQDKFNDENQNVLIMNAGIGNYNSERYTELFFDKLINTKPTDIFIHYFINDAEYLDQGRNNFILRNSQLAAILWMTIQKLVYGGSNQSLTDHYRNVYQDNSLGFKKMKSSLAKLKDFASKNNIRIYLSIIPDIHNLKDYPFEFIHKKMKNLASELGIEFIDMYPAFSMHNPKSLWAMPGDPHPNEIGHKLMANEIYKVIK